MTSPAGPLAERLWGRQGYRKTLLEKVEQAVALDVQRRKVDGRGFQQSKSLETVARLLDQIGRACTEFTALVPDQPALPAEPPAKHLADYAKLIRRIRKSLSLVAIDPAQSTTRQGLKIGRQTAKSLRRLNDLATADNHTGPFPVLHFQIARMLGLLNDLADALLAANFGPAVRLQNYKQLKQAAHALTSEAGSFGVERLALTRSGSTIAGLTTEPTGSGDIMAVYKEGQPHKVKEEIDGVDQWKKVFPKVAPSVLSHDIHADDRLASMVIEHLPGTTLEALILNGQWSMASQLLKKLEKTLRKIWKASHTRERCLPGYMQQLASRLPEVRQTHSALFNGRQTLCGFTRPGFETLMQQAAELEKRCPAPFSVLIHGDFNVDNLLFDDAKNRIYFIDLHRASYSDYVQDISVLMVSVYRMPVVEAARRARMMELVRQLYRFARRFARSREDDTFDLRLAIALARSFATSTRFVYDRKFAEKLAFRARYLLEAVAQLPEDALPRYQLPLEEIFSD